MAFKGGNAYHIEATAHKVYVAAAHEQCWVALLIAWAVIMHFEKEGSYGVDC